MPAAPVSAAQPVPDSAAMPAGPAQVPTPAEEAPLGAVESAKPARELPVVDVPWNEPPVTPPVAVETEAVEQFSQPAEAPEHHAAVIEVNEPDDDEPPLTDEDYFEVETQAEAFMDGLDDLAEEPKATEPAPAVEPASGLAAEWLEIFLKLGLGGLTGSIAANCTLISVDEDRWLMHLDPAQSALFNATQHRRLNDALNQYHGRTINLDIELQTPQQETPAQAAARRRSERQHAAEQSIQSDPVVQQLMQQFAAVIRDGTIEPVEHSEP